MAGVLLHILRTAYLFFLLLLSAATAAESHFDFGLSGRISIVKATYLMDGGTVFVTLCDERSVGAGVVYRNDVFYDAAEHGGQFSFTGRKSTKTAYFIKHSGDENALILLLRTASVTTFGTADPKKLSVFSSADPRRWERLAMAALFRSALASRTPKVSK